MKPPANASRPDAEALRGLKALPNGVKQLDQEPSIALLWAQAAHDLRQPVQAALLLSKLIDAAATPSEMRRAARHIGTSLKSFYVMLEFLTKLSRLEAGIESAVLRNCQLADVLAAPVREMAKVAAKRGIVLTTRNLRGLVRSNPPLLAIAARSLLLNAIKFGTGKEIIAGCQRRSDAIGIEIRFRGSGREAASEMSAFFELSAPAGTAQAAELGIGPLLLHRLCRRLGHGFEHTVSPPDGRRFAIWLPRGAPR